MSNAFFVSVFNTDDGLKGSQCPELDDRDCEIDQLPVNSELVWDVLLQLDPYMSMGPDATHPRIFKELGDVIMRPFLDDFGMLLGV